MEFNVYDSVADIYDTYVPADFDIPFFLEEAAAAGGGEILELMSGSGRVSIPLLQAGHRLTCVDLSAGLNAVHTRKLAELDLKAEILTLDVCEMDLGRVFSLVIIPFHSFAHLITEETQRAALDAVRRHLAPGGRFICTLTNPHLRRASVDGSLRLLRRYPLPQGGVLLLWCMESPAAEDSGVVEAKQFFEEYDAHGILARKRLMELRFRLTAREEFERLAREAGFRIQAFYGDYNRAPFNEESSPYMIWLFDCGNKEA